MQDERLLSIIKSLGQKRQLASLGEQPDVDMIGEPDIQGIAPNMDENEPIDPNMERSVQEKSKEELMQELANLKMGLGEKQAPDEDMVPALPEEQAMPDQDLKLQALKDVLLKMRK